MHLAGLWLTDFRCFQHAELHLPAGVTVINGANAQGKTTLLEAVGWAATGTSFRGVPEAALVRHGAETAVVRAEAVDGARTQLLFKWPAIVALIERPEPGVVAPVGGPTRRVLDVAAASAALTRQLHTRGIAMDEDDGRDATS